MLASAIVIAIVFTLIRVRGCPIYSRRLGQLGPIADSIARRLIRRAALALLMRVTA
jgi:hypothetical protein